MRWKAAAIGGYHDGENALADQLEGALGRRPARTAHLRHRRPASGRTTAERGKWLTEEADYKLTIVPSNLPKADTSPRT
jgi:hypothetical protein